MRNILVSLFFIFIPLVGLSQKNLISYDDIKYLISNNLFQADTFLVAKGYTIFKKDVNRGTRKYRLEFKSGTNSEIGMRQDGKKIFVEIMTNEIDQYNLIKESIIQYINKDVLVGDVQSYTIKDIGTIYISINDAEPYNPLRKDYNINIIPDKNITSYN